MNSLVFDFGLDEKIIMKLGDEGDGRERQMSIAMLTLAKLTDTSTPLTLN